MVRGRLWRLSYPHLDPAVREGLVKELISARRAIGVAKRAGDRAAEDAAHESVDLAKHGLGERGAVWWEDGVPDYNRHMARNSPYAARFAALG